MPERRIRGSRRILPIVLVVAFAAIFVTEGFPVPIASASAAASNVATTPLAATPALADVAAHEVETERANANPAVAAGANATNVSALLALTPAALLGEATGSTAIADVMETVGGGGGGGDSGLTLATFGPLQGYLEAAGIGCATTGGAFFAGAAAAYSISTAGLVVKDNPYTFALTCAVGAAVGLVIYQNGFNAGRAAICIGCLYAAFATAEADVFNLAVNATDAMYASLISLADYAQVGFDRAADNAALNQIGNSTFNASLDLQQSGLANSLGGLPTSYITQIASDFQNIPEWISVLASKGNTYAGYFEGPSPASMAANNLITLSGLVTGAYNSSLTSAVTPSSGAYGGLEVSAGDTFYYAGVQDEEAMLLLPHSATIPLHAYLDHTPSGLLAESVNVTSTNEGSVGNLFSTGTASSIGFVFALNLSAGWYLYPVGNTATLIVPSAFVMPTLSAPSMGTYTWADQYATLAAGYYQSGHGVSSCSWSAETPYTTDTLTAIAVSAFGEDAPIWVEDTGGLCGAGTSVTLATSLDYTTSAICAPTYVGGTTLGKFCFSPYDDLASDVGQLIVNATQSANVYWAFIRALGYTTLGSIPPNCIIPAPWMGLPSGVNFGNLTTAQVQAFYLAFLRGMGNFYGVNSTFSVCSGKPQNPYNFTANETWGNLYVQAWGGILLGSGSAYVNVTGKAYATAAYGSPDTWSVGNQTCDPSGSECAPLPPHAGQVTSSQLILAPTVSTVNIPVGRPWPVPAADPIVAYYYNNTTGLNALILQGNGTSTGPSSVFGSSLTGSALYLNSCYVNGSPESVCQVQVATWAVYLYTLCGENPTCYETNGGGGGGGGVSTTCGAGIPILGTIADEIAGAFGSIPFLNALGCAVGWVVAIVLAILVLAVVVWVVVKIADFALGRRA